MAIKYELPPFLEDTLTREVNVRWLHRKAQAHARRDRRRWKRTIPASDCKEAIHHAVLRSDGRGMYKHQPLDWSLLGEYDNLESRREGSKYKRRFALLPTVDHVDLESTEADFQICGWRTNDRKNDLTIAELRAFSETFRRAQAESSSPRRPRGCRMPC